MPKRYLLPFVPGLLTLTAGVTSSLAGPSARTQAYFAFQRQWVAHWPFEHGVVLPRVIEPLFRPFTPVWVQVEPGVKMFLDPEDYLSHRILETGAWEPATWAAMREQLGKGATFVDVGAHIGYYSLKAAPVVGASGRVVAIEPNPETVLRLRSNIQSSGASGIDVEPVACSEAEATLKLFAAPRANTGQSSLSHSNASQYGQSVTSYQVRARPLDAIIAETGVARVDVVKIDVEGAELLVLKGAQETLSRFHPVIMIELVDHQLREMGTSAQQVIAFLGSHGYTAHRSFDDNVEFVPAAGGLHSTN